mmetsp:Transcript_34127/g.81520  ORF Transcript_34127/g.81520 Transcript_34127/m.81520 type:complete len:128 (+) Transcript_34127:312-695(+)
MPQCLAARWAIAAHGYLAAVSSHISFTVRMKPLFGQGASNNMTALPSHGSQGMADEGSVLSLMFPCLSEDLLAPGFWSCRVPCSSSSFLEISDFCLWSLKPKTLGTKGRGRSKAIKEGNVCRKICGK